jgi:hypothetical protein
MLECVTRPLKHLIFSTTPKILINANFVAEPMLNDNLFFLEHTLEHYIFSLMATYSKGWRQLKKKQPASST